MKTRVLLINPPQTFYKNSLEFNVYFPLGLLSIAAIIHTDCDVFLYDSLVTDYQEKKGKDFITYGASDTNIRKAIALFRPDIVGISAPFTSQRHNVIRVAKLAKSYSKKVYIVVGGPDASVAGKNILHENSCIDICVQGEGEYVFQKIIHRYHSFQIQNPQTIPGIYYRRGRRVHYSGKNTPIMNLDALPFPHYDLINFNDYLNHPYIYRNRSSIPKQSISVITSRGCPYNCMFCSVFLHMSRVYRTYSHTYVLRHIRWLISKYHIKNFHFEDDNLTLNKVRFGKILDGLIASKAHIQWDTPNGVRADTLDYQLLKKMKRSGCASLTIAVESANQRVLDTIIDKHLDLLQTKKVAEWCQSLHIPLWAFFIIGFPGEKIQEMQQTITYALALYRYYDVSPYLFIATPLYGTRLYDVVMKNHYAAYPLTERRLATGTQLHGQHLIATQDFNARDIDKLITRYERTLLMIKKLKTWIQYKNRYNTPLLWLKKILSRILFTQH